jgi:RNA polymerase sigma-70 factor (ECF subfamily)
MNPTHLKSAAVLVLVVAVIGVTAAAEAPKKKSPPNNSGFGITSVAESLPVVVKTEPQAGLTDVDPAAVTEIKVTFSKDMESGNVSWVRTGKDTFPNATGKAHFLDDKRTCALPVKLESGKSYVIWLNKEPYASMMDKEGHKAVPYLLVFETRK